LTFRWLLTANYFCVPHFNPSNWIPPILLTTIEQLQLRDNRHIDWRNCNIIFILKSLPGIDSYLKIRFAWIKNLIFSCRRLKNRSPLFLHFECVKNKVAAEQTKEFLDEKEKLCLIRKCIATSDRKFWFWYRVVLKLCFVPFFIVFNFFCFWDFPKISWSKIDFLNTVFFKTLLLLLWINIGCCWKWPIWDREKLKTLTIKKQKAYKYKVLYW
jgi:hypothetical protein